MSKEELKYLGFCGKSMEKRQALFLENIQEINRYCTKNLYIINPLDYNLYLVDLNVYDAKLFMCTLDYAKKLSFSNVLFMKSAYNYHKKRNAILSTFSEYDYYEFIRTEEQNIFYDWVRERKLNDDSVGKNFEVWEAVRDLSEVLNSFSLSLDLLLYKNYTPL